MCVGIAGAAPRNGPVQPSPPGGGVVEPDGASADAGQERRHLSPAHPGQEGGETEQHEGRGDRCRQDEDMGQHGAHHSDSKPDRRNGGQAGDQQGDRADDLDEAADDAEPLSEADLIEDLHHHRRARELGAARSEEHEGEEDLERPGEDVAAA